MFLNKSGKYFLVVVVAIMFAGCARVPSGGSPEHLSLPPKPDTTNKTALALYDYLPVYQKAAEIPWAPINTTTPIKSGSVNAYLPEIRKRLIALNDYPASHYSDSLRYDPALARAVSLFQYENGLSRTGIIDQKTLNALNVTPATRFQLLVDSMYAWAKYAEDANSQYVLVNIPSYQLQVISSGSDVLNMKVIVGRPSRPTPTLSSKITTIVFNPHWNVPQTILAQDVIPGMQKNPNYLHEHYDMRVYASWNKDAAQINPSSIDWQTADAKTFPYRVTAPPSDANPLGRVKFLFNNEHDVYMHGTPEQSLFNLTIRARSSGCIRLEDPLALVRYFYDTNNDLNEMLTHEYLSSYDTKYIQLRYPMPVYVTYILVSVDNFGHLHFWPDIYHENSPQVGGGVINDDV